ncbi:MAG TPA: hypothetical protein VMF59_01900 [Bacteroidota bacterium]|nr:hypothetical protein [Bacteroidota bacterium]
MQIAGLRATRSVVVACAALAALSCSKDDIPTTPPPPFLFTNVEVSKFVTPPVTRVLSRGASYVAKFDVSYTLSAADDAQRNNLEVLAVVNSHDVNGNFVAVIGSLAYTPPLFTSAGGVVTDSIGFTVPGSGVSYVSVGARVVTRGSTITDGGKIGPYWSVQ